MRRRSASSLRPVCSSRTERLRYKAGGQRVGIGSNDVPGYVWCGKQCVDSKGKEAEMWPDRAGVQRTAFGNGMLFEECMQGSLRRTINFGQCTSMECRVKQVA